MHESDWMLLLGIPVIGVLVFTAARRARRLSARIAEYRAEQEQAQRNPYAELAELMSEYEADTKPRRAPHSK